MTRQQTDAGCAGCVVTLVVLAIACVIIGAAFSFGWSLVQ